MAHRFLRHEAAVASGKPLFVPVALAEGQGTPGIAVQLADMPPLGPTVSIAIAVPALTLLACLTLDEAACLHDELDRVIAELTARLQGGATNA